jgi:prepilin-type N-terminal cleavage/methylation domain-containing protein
MTAQNRTRNHGFSLVELSIVLVILGLLTGGILTGQSLIRASELRAITAEYQRYQTAAQTFRDKYFAIPGDMNNAGAFGWAGTGDADGLIENAATAAPNEVSLFWVQLGLAGLIEGSYTNTTGTTLTIGTHNPRSKISSAGWNVAQLGNMSIAGVPTPAAGATAPAAGTFYAGNYGNVLLLGSGTDSLAPGGILKAEEAWNIDTKMDDGRPDAGGVLTLESQGAATPNGCGNIAGATTALAASAYDLANSNGNECSLVFKMGF